jgi:glutathione S-transferase
MAEPKIVFYHGTPLSCPFAQRAWITLNLMHVDYKLVEIGTKSKMRPNTASYSVIRSLEQTIGI